MCNKPTTVFKECLRAWPNVEQSEHCDAKPNRSSRRNVYPFPIIWMIIQWLAVLKRKSDSDLVDTSWWASSAPGIVSSHPLLDRSITHLSLGIQLACWRRQCSYSWTGRWCCFVYKPPVVPTQVSSNQELCSRAVRTFKCLANNALLGMALTRLVYSVHGTYHILLDIQGNLRLIRVQYAIQVVHKVGKGEAQFGECDVSLWVMWSGDISAFVA